MPSIDINLHHIAMDAAQESGAGSSDGYLKSILNRLDNTLQKLNTSLDRAVGEGSLSGGGGVSSGGSGKGFKDNFTNIASTLGQGLGAAIGITAARMFHNEATAIMARASNAGNFVASAIGGNANQQFGAYASQFVNIAAQRLMANNSALAQGVGGVAGGALGAAAGFVGGVAADSPSAALTLGKMGMTAGGAAGIGVGDYAAAKYANQYIQQQSLVIAARIQREANASVAQWHLGFSRWGNAMENKTLVPGAITGGADINAPLSKEFERRYGNSQNYNAILNNIVPNLAGNPLSARTGDLDKIAQRFLQAGYAVSDFGNLTRQANQYIAKTGKTFEDFSKLASIGKTIYGDSYTASTNQLANNLMNMYGISLPTAQNMAYQSQYNPGVLSGMQIEGGSSLSQWYTLDFIGKQFGIKNLNEQIATGHVDSDLIRKTALEGMQGKNPKNNFYHRGLLNASGMSYSTWAQLTTPQVKGESLTPEQLKKAADAINNPSLSPGQTAAETAGTGIMQGLMSIGTANINANIVNLTATTTVGSGIWSAVKSGIHTAWQDYKKYGLGIDPPHPSNGGYTPTKN